LTAPLLLTVIAGVLVVSAAVLSRRDLRRWLGHDPSPRLRVVRAALLVATLGALAVAWAGAHSTPPRLGGGSADVVVMIDVSRSMDTRDTPPSRLRRAVRFAERFVERAAGIRVGLVAFAGAAFPLVPLTQDRDAVLTYLAALDTELMSKPGTDLAAGLERAASVFDPTSSRPRMVLLLTDGEQGEGNVDGLLGDLRARGIRVVPVGFGTPSGGVVPGRSGGLRDEDGQIVRSRRRDAVLRRIAAATGAAYHREPEERPDPSGLIPRPDPVAREEKEKRPEPLPFWVVIAAVALVVEIVLSSPRRRPAGGVAVAGVAALLLAAGPRSWIEEGDRKLERGEARAALSLYRKAERTSGTKAETQIRVGNAMYRLATLGLASGSYVEALRLLGPEDTELRFVAAFNLGTALLAQERYREAQDAFWTALMAQPGDLEAKFNYEWSAARVPPEEEPPTPSVTNRESERARDGDGARDAPHPVPTEKRRPPPRADLGPEEAKRWLRGIEDDPTEALRDQIGGRAGPSRRGGQTW
jgi:Ca-activated chloride channel family protein